MNWNATGDHWSEEIGSADDPEVRLHYLKLAYVMQIHEGGLWYACCLGERFGGFPDRAAAMRRCGAYLADNWHKVEWMKSQ